MEMKINFIDVGCRGKLPTPWRYEFMDNLLAIDARGSLPTDEGADSTIRLKDCIFDKEGVRELYVLNKKECSSLFRPNGKLIGQFAKASGKDPKRYYVHRRKRVTCKRLDSILASQKIEYDFLKVDVQGADLPVIKSSGKYLDDFVGVQMEVFYFPFYKGIYLIDDIRDYMHEKGFHLYCSVVDSLFFGDCVFIKEKTSKKDKLDFIKTLYRPYRCQRDGGTFRFCESKISW